MPLNRRDYGIAGLIGSGVSVAGDLLLTGGDLIVAIVLVASSLAEAWLPIVSTTAAYIAPEVEWLDQSLVRSLLFTIAAFYVGGVLVRRLRRSLNSNNDT